MRKIKIKKDMFKDLKYEVKINVENISACTHPTGYCKGGYDICGHCGAVVGGSGEEDFTKWETNLRPSKNKE